MDIKRCFEILEIEPDSSRSEVKQAYRDLASIWHPDRYTHNTRLHRKAEKKLKELNLAYETVLSFLESKEEAERSAYAGAQADGFQRKAEDYAEEAFIICTNCGATNRIREYHLKFSLKCGRCGFGLQHYEETKEDESWEIRTPCSDETCTGIIGADGRCGVCGKPYEKAQSWKAETDTKDTTGAGTETNTKAEDDVPSHTVMYQLLKFIRLKSVINFLYGVNDRKFPAKTKTKTKIGVEVGRLATFLKMPIGYVKAFGDSIAFPNECFVCGGKSEKQYKVTRTQLTGYYLIYFSYRTLKLKVPVCKRHYWQLVVLRILFWTLLIGFFLTFDFPTLALLILIAFPFIAIKYLFMKNSLTIYSITKESPYLNEIIFSSNRKDYFEKLCQMEGLEPILRPEHWIVTTIKLAIIIFIFSAVWISSFVSVLGNM